jgi:DNA-binding beta-propeller fold protein YncE
MLIRPTGSRGPTVALIVIFGALLTPASMLAHGAGLGGGPQVSSPTDSPRVFGSLQEINVTMPSGVSPHAVTWDPQGGGFAISDVGYDQVLLLNASSGTLLRTGSTGQDPSAISFDGPHGLLWVANPDSLDLSLLNATTLTTEATISLPASAYAVAADPPLGIAMVPLRNLNEIAEVGISGSVQTLSVGSQPIDVAVDDSRGLAYVADGGGSTISVVQVAPFKIVRNLSVVDQPTGVALDPVRDLLLVSSSLSGTLDVYNASNGAPVANVSIGSGGGRVAVCPSLGGAVVPAFEAGEVSLVSEATWTVTDTYTTPWGPFGTGIDSTCQRILVADEFAQAVTLLAPPSSIPFGTVTGTVAPYSVNDSLTVNDTQVVLAHSGAFSDSLPPGTYWLNASAPGLQSSDRQIVIEAGQVLHVSIQLQSPSVGFPVVLALEVGGAAALIVGAALFVLFSWRKRRQKRYGEIPEDSPIREL